MQPEGVRRLILFLTVMSVILRPSLSMVHRLYSPTSEIGHSHACGNVTDRVILTCHATGSRVTWTATSDLFRRIIFSNSDAAWKVINQGVITGILLQNEPELDGSNMRNFISELLVYTTSSSMSVNITCSSDSGSSSHVIAPPALPGQPMFKEPQLLVQTDLSAQYYLEWEPPSNSQNFDLDHYQLFSANDSLLQRIHSDQHYAVVTVGKGVTTTIKLAAVDKCGQVSTHASTSITPSVISEHEMTPAPDSNDHTTTTATTGKGQNFQSRSSSDLLLAVIICTTLVALVIIVTGILLVILVARRTYSQKSIDVELVKEEDLDSKTSS